MRSRNILGLVFVGAAFLAACGSSGGRYTSTAPPAAKTASTTKAISVSPSPLGNILVNADGRSLYGFTNDKNGMSSCVGTCSNAWPPVIVSRDWKAPTNGVAKLHTVPRPDGQLQLAVGKWPLYTFAGDTAAGDVNGQGSLGKWFVVQPDGVLHKGGPAQSSPAVSTPTTAPASMAGYGY